MLAGQSRTIYAENASGGSNPKTSQKGRPIAVGRSFAFLSRSFRLPANAASLESLPISNLSSVCCATSVPATACPNWGVWAHVRAPQKVMVAR